MTLPGLGTSVWYPSGAVMATTGPSLLPRFAAFFVGTSVALAVLCAPALAQQGQGDHAARSAAARSLFEEGLGFLDREEFPQAADRFERALAIRPSAQIAYNLSTALIAMGRLVRASEVLLVATRDAEAPQEVRDAAERRRQELLPRIARLTVHASGDRGETTVELDSRPMDWAMVGVAIPVDPGAHELVATRGDTVVAREPFEVEEGGSAEVTLSLPSVPTPRETAETAVGPEPTPVEPSPPEEEGASTWWIWAGLGAVVIAGAIVAVVLLAPSEPNAIDGTAGSVDLR